MSPTFRSLHNPNYRRYAAGAVVSNTGTWMQRVAQDWLVLQLAVNGGTAVGITTGLQFLPALLLSPLAGVVADRVPKRSLLQVTQVMMAVPAFLLGLLAVTGVAEVWHVYVLALVFGIGTAFDAPARQSFVSEIVSDDDLTNAVGLNSASFNAARVVGPAVAGVLIAALGGGATATGWVIMINAVTYLAPILALRRMNPETLSTVTPAGRTPGMAREGLRYVRSRPDLMLVLAIVFVVGTFGLNFQMTSALMATDVFGKGATEYGLLGTFMAVGSLTGALLAARRTRIRLRLVVVAAIAFGLSEVVAGLLPTYLTFAVWMPVLGLTALTMITAANTLMQVSTAPALRGRVMALYLMIFMGGTPLGAPVVGWVGETFGARWTLLGGGAMTLIGVGIATALYLLRPGARSPVLTPAGGAGSLFPRVWDNQAVARARK
ncbi:MFS transporter [Nocardioides dongkuii]|uniref:MFS transporter n=1 Tax=Nocardioides dongkuii TaxID=2760089 RepID=UPI0015FA9FD7|nr:MFS transporter [Nocardioides dongkuii]